MAIVRGMLMNKVSMGLYEHDKWSFLLLHNLQNILVKKLSMDNSCPRPSALNQAPLRPGDSHFSLSRCILGFNCKEADQQFLMSVCV